MSTKPPTVEAVPPGQQRRDGQPAKRKGKPLSDWNAPVYSESRRVKIDSEQAALHRLICYRMDAEEVEYYKILRTKIQQKSREKGWNSLMVTSAAPGEGKTVTAINLALTMAKEFNQTVLLVDCDLRRQSIHRYLGFQNDCGLTDYLVYERPLSELITWPGVDKLTLISGGKDVRESTELLGSPRMAALVEEMKSRYPDRYIIFDVPPILSSADALAFTPLADAVLLVVEDGRTPMQSILKAVSLLPPEKFLGFVLNKHHFPAGKGRDPYLMPKVYSRLLPLP